jgi:hypothetical protein
MVNQNHTQIGTAWQGTHVVLIRCNFLTNQVLSITKSNHAPSEPASSSCAETLSRFLSIGYTVIGGYPLNQTEIQYLLIYR